MREIKARILSDKVRELFIKANVKLPCDTAMRIKEACETETSGAGAAALRVAVANLEAAELNEMPICQDTGMAVVFCEIGNEVHITDGDFEEAINDGVRRAYKDGYFRCSVVADPLFERKNTTDNTPAIIHTRIVKGDKIKLWAEPKGFGSENMSKIKMFNPSASRQDIIDFVVDTVKSAGGNPCPPVVIGVGIGGTFDYCAVLAKKALTRAVSEGNSNSMYAKLEEDILSALNETGVGPQGFGGKTTALGVNIEYYPTHIAGLPVAVNVNCHVARHAEAEI
ncbi:MAG: fumarate hydratase [Clostridia bacterium]|nr:fumarate hydratase [Clostridia bacterium]